MDIKFYVIPGSHPCAAVIAAAEYKGLAYTKVNVLPVQHKIQMRLMFGRGTVPAMKLDGEKVTPSKAIMHSLDAAQPQPPLFPAEADRRRAVEDAIDWADGDFQDIGRRILWQHLVRAPGSMLSYAGDEKLPIPRSIAGLFAKPTAMISAWYNHADADHVRADIAKLPELLDRVDEYVEQGTIGGEQPNAADFLLGASLALWMTVDDLRPYIESRPGGRLARRLYPDFAGNVPGGVLPAEWLAPLTAGATTAQSA